MVRAIRVGLRLAALALAVTLVVSGATQDAHAQKKAIAEGVVKLFTKEGGAAGRAFVVSRGAIGARTTVMSMETVATGTALDCAGHCTVPIVNLQGQIDKAAKVAVVGGGSEHGGALMDKLGMDAVEDVAMIKPTDVDGYIVAMTRNGDMVYIDPSVSMPTEDILAIARDHAVLPSNGQVTGNGIAFYTNGIRNTPAQHAETMQIIAESTGHPTLGVYNATEGGLKDAAQTAVDRIANLRWRFSSMFGNYDIGPIRNNPAVRSVAEVQVVLAREGVPLQYFFHSQGGVIGSRGTQRATSVLKEEGGNLKNTRIVSMGSAAPVWIRDPSGPQLLEHYVHVGDLTPRFLGLGGNYRGLFGLDAFQTGGPPNAIIHRFAGDAPNFFPAQGQLRDWVQIGKQRVRVVANHDVNNTYLQYYQQLNPIGSPRLANVNGVNVQGDLSKLLGEGSIPEQGITLSVEDIQGIRHVAGRYELRLTDGSVVYTDKLLTTTPQP